MEYIFYKYYLNDYIDIVDFCIVRFLIRYNIPLLFMFNFSLTLFQHLYKSINTSRLNYKKCDLT